MSQEHIEWDQVPLSEMLSKSAKHTYLAELLSTDLSRRWDKTFVLAVSFSRNEPSRKSQN